MGAAVKTGVEKARYPWVFVSCSDLQFKMSELAEFLPLARGADIILGFRLERSEGLYRRFNSFIYHFLLRVFFGLRVKDPSWVKLFRREIFKDIDIVQQGFLWDVEVLVKAQKYNLVIKEAAVHSYPRQAGKSSSWTEKGFF